MKQLTVRTLNSSDKPFIETLLRMIGWEEPYIIGQLESIDKLLLNPNGEIYVADDASSILGFIQVEHHTWNRLSQVQGLVVHPHHRRIGIANKLIQTITHSSHKNKSRGIYVDTPVDNLVGRKFYTAVGFHEAYIMPEYYAPGLDGVTFQKFLF